MNVRSLSLLLLVLVACNAQDGTKVISKVRQVPKSGPAHPAVSSASRFGFHEEASATSESAPTAPSAGESLSRLTWTAPPGWQQAAPAPMRIVSFKMGESGKAECYLSVLAGEAGGLEANINRWRNQMGQAPLSGAEISKLNKISVLGHEAPMVEISGAFSAMDGATRKDYGMRGAILQLGGQSLFIKMVGPAGEVTAQRQHFIDFCKSLAIR